MSAVPERPRLGQVLMDAGLIDEATLRAALAEQQRSGRPLGEVLIKQGYVSAPAVANALADQHGGLLKTEYGFAMGFRGRRPAPSTAPPPPPPALIGPPPPSNTIADHLSHLSERFGRVPPQPASEPAGEAEMPRLRLAQPPPEPESMSAVVEAPPEPALPAPAPAEAPTVQILTDALRTLDELLATVEQRARDLEEVAAALEPESDGVAAALSPPAAGPCDRHMLLVPTPRGTELVARTGPAPIFGSHVELLVAGELVRFSVAEIAPAPLPGPYVPCARLVQT